MATKLIETLFENNRDWSLEKRRIDPDYFKKLSQLQKPQYLWIGCSDSRVPANVIAGLEPGEVFVHRNIANLIHPADLNLLSVVEYAVSQLAVKHIIVCGHYGCGGVRAAVEGTSLELTNHWLQPIRDLATMRFSSFACKSATEDDLDRLCEFCVIDQVQRLARTPTLQAAWKRQQDISIHGWIYGLNDGLLHDLGCTVADGCSN